MGLDVYVADSEAGRAKLLCIIEEHKFGVQKAILEGKREKGEGDRSQQNSEGLAVSGVKCQ